MEFGDYVANCLPKYVQQVNSQCDIIELMILNEFDIIYHLCVSFTYVVTS